MNKWRIPVLRKELTSIFDWVLLVPMLLLVTISIVALNSAGFDIYTQESDRVYITQFIAAIFGLVSLVLIMIVDYTKFRKYAYWIYGFGCLLVIITLVFGQRIRGVKGWLAIGGHSVQFSEFMKIAVIIMLARYLENRAKEINTVFDLIVPGIIVGVPFLMILMQPDLGTALVFIPIIIFMLIIDDADISLIISVVSIALIGVSIPVYVTYSSHVSPAALPPLAVFFSKTNNLLLMALIASVLIIGTIVIHNIKKIRLNEIFMRVFIVVIFASLLAAVFDTILQPYQQMRLVVAVNPEKLPDELQRGEAYNIIQSMIAFGSGGFFGQGYMHGTQSQLGFLPEQETDFIISVIGEEFGWFGILIVCVLFLIIFLRLVYIINNAKDMFGALIVSGILGMFLFHFLINIGMALGMMPATGIPLPFISRGGTSLVMSMTALGIAMNIESRRFVNL